MIQKLSKEQMKFIFDNHMINDFPKSELKPWKKIEAGLENDTYFAYGMYENNELLAYAFFIKSSKYNTYLLDYLAVLSGKEHVGNGGEIRGQRPCHRHHHEPENRCDLRHGDLSVLRPEQSLGDLRSRCGGTAERTAGIGVSGRISGSQRKTVAEQVDQ
mgnify:CR=1 FL=1